MSSHQGRMADDVLALAVKERVKELNKICGRLRLDGLIKMCVQCEFEVVFSWFFWEDTPNTQEKLDGW